MTITTGSPPETFSFAAPRTLVVAIAALALLAVANLLFHGMYQGADLWRGLICEDAYRYFPGPLFAADDRFMDFFNMQRFDPMPPRNDLSALPPSLILLYKLANTVTQTSSPTISIILFSAWQFALFCFAIIRLLDNPVVALRTTPAVRVAVAVLVCLVAYPVWFTIDRGNGALTVAALIGLSMDAHLRGKYWHSAVLIGLAAALRITPLLFAAIYFNRAHFRYLLAAVITTLVCWTLSVAALSFFLPGYSLQVWFDGFGSHGFMYTTWTHGLGWSSSLYNLVRYARYLIGIPQDQILETAYLAERFFSFFALGALALVAWRTRGADALTAFTLLSWAFIALQHVTGDYYLTMLIPPLVLYCLQARKDFLTIALLILLISPKDYFYYYVMPHRLFDFKLFDLVDYQNLLARGFKPSSIQALLINPLLLALLGIRLFTSSARASAARD